jgi:hypothetical protein
MAVDPGTPAPQEPSLKPTRKWWATQIVALTALAVMYVTTGAWDQEETISAIGIASQAALAWLVPNEATVPRTGVEAKGE